MEAVVPAASHAPALRDILTRGSLRRSACDDVEVPAPGGAPWLFVSTERADAAFLINVLRALHDLAELARNDAATWAQMLREMWPAQESQRWIEQWELAPRPAQTRRRDRLQAALVELAPRPAPPVIGLCVLCYLAEDLTSLQQAMLSLTSTLPHIPITINVMTSRHGDRALEAIEVMAKLRDAHDIVGVGYVNLLDNASLRAISRIAQRGIDVYNLRTLRFDLTPHNAVAVVADLQLLLPTHSDAAPTCVHSASVQLTDPLANRLNACLLSVGDSASVHALEVSCHNTTSEAFVRWLAFALFSSWARHSVQTLKFAFPFTDDRLVRAFSDVVQARDPLVGLFPSDRARIEANETIRISATRFYLYHPNRVVFEGLRRTGLRVISKSSDCCSVLLPGWGRAWVRTDDAVVSIVEEEEPKGYHSIPAIELDGANLETLPWLALIGQEVTHFTLDGYSHNETVPVARLKAAFPNLMALRLRRMRIDALSLLFDGDAWPALETLVLDKVAVDNTDDIVLLLQALSRRDHRLATTMRSLPSVVWSHDSALLETVLAMLRANTHLQFSSLAIPAEQRH